VELVELVRNNIYCDSSMVAKKFSQKHNKVIGIIENLLEDLSKTRGSSNTPKCEMITKEYKGQVYKAYLMDRRFFSLLGMRFKGVKALEWQLKFNDAFYEMEERILSEKKNKTDDNYIEARKQSVIGRREETDVIEDFIKYAIKQGSKSAKWYYKHITNATYRALELMVHKKPAIRNTLNPYQIAELILAERLAKNSLKKYMDMGRNYKDIFECVKTDLIDFSKTIKIS